MPRHNPQPVEASLAGLIWLQLRLKVVLLGGVLQGWLLGEDCGQEGTEGDGEVDEVHSHDRTAVGRRWSSVSAGSGQVLSNESIEVNK